jgi:hypothetical protein
VASVGRASRQQGEGSRAAAGCCGTTTASRFRLLRRSLGKNGNLAGPRQDIFGPAPEKQQAMSSSKRTSAEPSREDPEFGSANAGWDPYVAALLGGANIPAPSFLHAERRTQVMTLGRRIAGYLARGKR